MTNAVHAEVMASAAALMAPLSRRAARERLNSVETQSTASTDIQPLASASEKTLDTAADMREASPVAAAIIESAPEPRAAAPTAEEIAIDAFERASRAFRTAESRIATQPTDAAASDAVATEAPAAPADGEADPVAIADHLAPRRPRLRKVVALGATAGVMGLAGLLAVSMTLPAEAVAAVQGTQALSATSLVAGSAVEAEEAADEEIQAFVASSDVQNDSLLRAEDYSTVSLVDIAAEQGINYSSEVYTNDPEAAIQWPFLVGVGMSWGYGMRSGRLHEGIDFVPGNGAPIQAIADGTVRIATEQGGAFGVTVYIDHVIDGQVITSHYSHMQYGSLQVEAGQTVKVGDIVGKTGNTGRSYGAHLHFELIVNGSTIDPLPWLRENAGRSSY